MRGQKRGPSRGVMDAIQRRLKDGECPVCGVKIQEAVDLSKPGIAIGLGRTVKMVVCLNGHRQDVWAAQRPKESS